jgi:hypothetical protein
MADRVVLCPGLNPDLIRGFSLPPEMVEDLLAISQIPDDAIEAIAAAIEAEAGFVGGERLTKLVMGVIPDEASASAVVSTLYNVQPHRLGETIEILREWRGADQRNAGKFPDQALVALEAKLPRLIRDYPVLTRSRKARRLRSILGNRFRGIELICDARPVYNAVRDSIEGLVPLTTMKIVYEGQDEETREVEVTLTREAVNELAEKVQKAQRKLDILDHSIAEWIPDGLAIPE